MYDDKTIEELKSEADSLGITYSGNIGKTKLIEKIEEFYNNEANKDTPEVKEEVEVAKPQAPVNKIAEAKKKAMKLIKCVISSNDKRTSDVETTAYIGFENQHFGMSRLVPLDTPIELESALVNIARTTKILQHRDEIVDGKRTGNKVPTMTRKYNVQLL